jgi:hypothetical protein
MEISFTDVPAFVLALVPGAPTRRNDYRIGLMPLVE